MAEVQTSGPKGKGLGRSLLLIFATLVVAFIVVNLVYSETAAEARISVPQSPDQVWSVLTDYPSYPRWNSVMYRVTGDLAVGKQLHVATKNLKWSPTILAVEPGRELRWLGVLVVGGKRLGGFYEGEHRWELFRNKSGGTDIVQREDFRGLFTWYFAPTTANGASNSFAQTNRDLAAELARRYPVPAASGATAASAPAAAGR